MSEPIPESEFVDEEVDAGIDVDEDIVTEGDSVESENGKQASAADEANVVEEEQAAEEPEPLDPMEALQREVDKWRDVAARSQADLENFRKRMAREKTDSIQFANRSLLQTLLPVIDNFEMGMKMAANENQDSMIFKGMEMVQKQLNDFLSENHVEVIESEGQPFDPNVHEAIKQEASGEVPENHVIFEMRRGYRLRDRLLRPANVVVSTGTNSEDPKADGEEEATPENSPE